VDLICSKFARCPLINFNTYVSTLITRRYLVLRVLQLAHVSGIFESFERSLAPDRILQMAIGYICGSLIQYLVFSCCLRQYYKLVGSDSDFTRMSD